MSDDRVEVKELRRQIRDWREGRAEKSLMEVLSDAYIACFATVMLGAIGINVVIQTRTETAAACHTIACADARTALPWIFALSTVGLSLIAARLFGPLLISPAEGAWLFAAPVDRRSLLRPRLIQAALISLLAGLLVGAVDATIGGFGVGAGAAFTLTVAAASIAMVMLAAVDQSHGGRVGRFMTWTFLMLIWAGLLLIAADRVPQRLPSSRRAGLTDLLVLAAVTVVAITLLRRAYAGLARMQRDRLAVGGSLLSNLSGAFASLDPNLAYDVLMSRRWREKATVRPVRGGPAGAWALVWRDVIRLRRSTHTVVILAASLVLPFVAATVGLGKAAVLIATTTGFLAGVGLCTGLRVLVRTPGLSRCMPMSPAATRTAGLAVPATILLIWGLATTPAMHHAMAPMPWNESAGVALAVGLSSLTAVTRWITAKPADYSAPLMTSPAGAIPASMFTTILRGFDFLLLTSAPLLLLSPSTGATVSMGLSTMITGILLSKR